MQSTLLSFFMLIHPTLLPAATVPAAPPEDRIVILHTSVADRSDETVLFSSTSALSPHSPLRFSAGGQEQNLDVSVELEPLGGDEYVLRMHWKEERGGGRRLHWAPTVRLARGATARGLVDWGNGTGRVVTFTLEK